MKYIEMLTAWSPDNGDGSFELAIAFSLALLAVWLLAQRRSRRNTHRLGDSAGPR